MFVQRRRPLLASGSGAIPAHHTSVVQRVLPLGEGGSVRDLNDRVALVTGAGSGIGRETALALARKGARLIVCDLREDSLREVQVELDAVSRCLLAKVVDVADRSQMEALAHEVHDLVPAVDVLVNNAGIGHSGGVLSTTLEDWDRVIGVNLWGVIYGCHYFVANMVKRGEGGHIVNLSSLLGYVGVPGALPYVTTKFSVFGYSESLRAELRDYGIGVSTICPGIVRTNIIQNTVFRGVDDAGQTRRKVDEMYRRRDYGPDRVAKAIISAIGNKRSVVPVSPESWFSYYLKRLSPRLSAWLARRTVQQQLG